MTDTSKASPRPWAVRRRMADNGEVAHELIDAEGGFIGDVWFDDDEANADLIAHAVNAHDDLVATLEKCASILVAAQRSARAALNARATYRIEGHGIVSVGDVLDAADFALAKARGDW